MAAIPTLEEDAKRPTREREHLVGMRTHVINRMKGTLIRLGIRDFNPKLRKAPERVAALRTPEGTLIAHWPNCVSSTQITEIENAPRQQLEQGPQDGANTRVLELASVSGIGIETAKMLTHEVFSRALRDQ